MIDKTQNPWLNMDPDSVRRIDSTLIHNLFWMTDQKGNYGFYLKTTLEFANIELDIRLKGISIVKRNLGGFGELFLIVNKHTDWELFLSLCNDLINVCSNYQSNEQMVIAVENRLKRWQYFLMQNSEISLSLILQMGLFTELKFLIEVLGPNRGIKEALLAWGGPNADKQDFSLPDLSVEVKSYISSKGPYITISSSHQLLPNSKSLYLVAYGLTVSEQGNSITDLITKIDDILSQEYPDLIQVFESKLIAYGYMPGVTYNTLYNFIDNSIRVFEVEEKFPSILPHQIPPEIISINYTLDLQLCTKFEKTISSLLETTN